MKKIMVLAVMFCSFSAYSHPLNMAGYYEVTRFNSAEFSSVIVFYEEGFFTNSFYLHYHVYRRKQITNLPTYLPHQNGEYTFEISRDHYESIINNKYPYKRIAPNPNANYFDNRVIFY